MNVSIICACKNRTKPLSISLQSWLLWDEVKEIIIVDWSSDESLSYLTKIDSRIKVISVPNKKYFNQPQPLNLAASIATGDFILKFDCDHIINPYWNFFEKYSVDENSFATGFSDYESPEYINENGISCVNHTKMQFSEVVNYCNQYSEYYKSLIGMLFVSRDNFFKCGGYNENLGDYYGFEDEELMNRLEFLGLSHKKMNYDHNLFHIPHPDSKRIENFKEGNNVLNQVRETLSSYYSGDVLENQANYGAAEINVKQNKNIFGDIKSYYIKPKTKWNIQKIDDQNYIAKEIDNNKLENFPSAYYVTLEECVDRQQQIESQFLNYGVNIKPLKSNRSLESNDIVTGKYVHQLNAPTKGCIVSHLKAIKLWYETEESDYAFFCEDDLSLKTVENWNFTWKQFINNLPNDWGCVQLMTIRGDFKEICFRDRKWDDWSQTAYIMKRDYARKIIQNYCPDNTFHLELKDCEVMPLGENILFSNIGKVYTFPLFVENIDTPSTQIHIDLEIENGQKPNHIYASEYVYEWWKNNGKLKTIEQLMNIKPMKNIVDCFTYFNEKELLELRINLLKDYVDKFIIVDGNYTHSGIPKQFTCKKVIEELELPQDMIEVIEVDLSEENLDAATDYDRQWSPNVIHASRERTQRDAISKCLETNNFNENTIFIVSDCDEIIDPKHLSMLSQLVRDNRDKIFKVDLVNLEGRADFCSYDKDSNTPVEWRYSLFLCLKEHMENTKLTYVRSDFNIPYQIVWPYTTPREENGVFISGERMKNLGWHFTWMGNNQNRITKSQSFCHSSQEFNFINYNYSSNDMKDFMSDYEFFEGNIPPSGNINYILKSYSIENLPQIIFELPRVKNYLLPTTTQKIKTELEQLLYTFSLDTENPENNFNLGIWYENDNHTAPALSYFLRCAERSHYTDENLAYEALIHASRCYDKQGTRDGSARSLLWQAQMFLPHRPEAYYLLAKIAEKNEWWQDCYSTCELGLRYCDFNVPDLKTYVDYPGKHGLMFLKANSAWWWGKGDEARTLYRQILDDYELNEHDYNLVYECLKKVNGNLPEESKPIDFSYDNNFDWSELSYEDKITIDREIVVEKVYRFWEDVKEGDIVLDIGASVGAYTISILDQKPKKVYCVEPSKKLLKSLIKNCSEKVLNYKESPLVCINKGIVSDVGNKINIFGGEEDFDGITFKDLIQEYSINHIDFMKVDCEGGEYDIFMKENMNFLTNNIDFIAIEIHLNYEGCRDKFKKFRDECLVQFKNYKVMSCTRQNISWGNSIDIKDKIFDDDFIDNYTCEFMIYIKNR